MTDKQKEEIYLKYSANNMQKIRQIIYKSVSIFGEYDGSINYDDFLSRANITLWQLVNSFDESRGVPFEAYMRKRLPMKMMQVETLQNRDVRMDYVRDRYGNKVIGKDGKYIRIKPVYINAKDKEGVEIGEKIASKFNIDDEMPEETGLTSNNEEEWHEEVKEYLKSLSPLQRKIIRRISNNYTKEEICEELHITSTHYNNSLKRLMASEKTEPLRKLLEKENRR